MRHTPDTLIECINCGGHYTLSRVIQDRVKRYWCSFCGGWGDTKKRDW
jgi:hypothetical protein